MFGILSQAVVREPKRPGIPEVLSQSGRPALGYTSHQESVMTYAVPQSEAGLPMRGSSPFIGSPHAELRHRKSITGPRRVHPPLEDCIGEL